MHRSANIPQSGSLELSCSSGSHFVVRYMDFYGQRASHIAMFNLESQRPVQTLMVDSAPNPEEDLCLQEWSRDGSFAIFWNVRSFKLYVARLSKSSKVVRVVSHLHMQRPCC